MSGKFKYGTKLNNLIELQVGQSQAPAVFYDTGSLFLRTNYCISRYFYIANITHKMFS